MRVLFLQRQPCIRALKYAVAIRKAEPGIELGFAYQGRTLSDYYGSGDELFDRWWDLGVAGQPARELARAIDEFAPDIIHSHNLPDSLTVLALELVGGSIPIVHDIHDLQSLRTTQYRDGFPEPPDPLALERWAVERADAVVTVSQELVNVLDASYALAAPVTVIPNLALDRDLPDLPGPSVDPDPVRVVYQGSLATDGSHYDLREIFVALISDGIELHVHPSRPAPAYLALAERTPGLSVHTPMDPGALMVALARYDVGWAGFNATMNAAHLDTVLPNKLFEYLGCGLPVATLAGHAALSRFVADEGVGIVLAEAAGLGEVLRDLPLRMLRSRVVSARGAFTFEGRIHGLLDLYRSLLERPLASPNLEGAPLAR